MEFFSKPKNFTLPTDLICCIYSYLSLKESLNLRLVHSNWNESINETFWEIFSKRDYKSTTKLYNTWREDYLDRYKFSKFGFIQYEDYRNLRHLLHESHIYFLCENEEFKRIYTPKMINSEYIKNNFFSNSNSNHEFVFTFINDKEKGKIILKK